MRWVHGALIGLGAFGASAFIGEIRMRSQLDACEHSTEDVRDVLAAKRRWVDEAFDAGRRYEQINDSEMCGRLPRKAMADCVAPIAHGAVVACLEIDGMRCVCGKEGP